MCTVSLEREVGEKKRETWSRFYTTNYKTVKTSAGKKLIILSAAVWAAPVLV